MRPTHIQAMAHLVVNSRIAILDTELGEDFIRASGPGGQNVNKVSSAVQLRFDVANSPSLPWEVKARLTALAGSRLTKNGVLIITAQNHRTQDDNRREARERLVELIREACVVPKKRWATKPTRGSKERRLQSKKVHSATKRNRQVRHDD
jgi:ribosome-associated protein